MLLGCISARETSAAWNVAQGAKSERQANLHCGLQVGLKVLQEDGNVLKCHTNHWDNKWYAETGASSAILEKGYNIGSLMKR
jgi:hypothetical protein